MVKFASPLEFYDWYDANREELLAFKESHDSSRGIGSYFYSSGRIGRKPIPPGGPGTHKHKYWHTFSDEYPTRKKEDVFEEDTIYIVSNSHQSRFKKWWVIYIPIPLYKQTHSIENPFQKEAWWYYRDGEKVPNSIASPDLEWVSSFIKYEGIVPLGFQTLNYPRGV